LFGSLQAERAGRLITRFRTQKTAVLLAYLAYHPDRPHAREALIERLWPEQPARSGHANLSTALSVIRRELATGDLRAPILLADRAGVQLNPAAVTTDVRQFEAALEAAARADAPSERAQRWVEAVELHRGPLLADFCEGWVLQERPWLEGRYFETLGKLLLHLERQGEIRRALLLAQQGVRLDPLREEAHRDLMRLYAAAGQPAEALRQYEELRRRLDLELSSAPEAATLALVRDIRERQAEPATSLTRTPLPALAPSAEIPTAGGAVPLGSPHYVARPVDALFHAALARGESIVLIKGARQMGKTSLLARGLQAAREAGGRVIRTDLQLLDAASLETADGFLRALAAWIADELDLEVRPDQAWQPHLGASVNLTRFLRRHVLREVAAPITWGLDEVDRLFGCDFGSQVFGMFRAWHNDRALDPAGPWSRFTLVMAYATEHHLFIADLNQSPFNVGTRLFLDDFTPEQVADLNCRFGAPLRDENEIARLVHLVGGHPFLVHSGLRQIATGTGGLERLEAQADRDDGPFGDHLRRLWVSLQRDAELCDAVRAVLHDQPCPTEGSFYRLRSAGILAGDSPHDARPRCRLYAAFLGRRLR
jgi:DNA-binding SARP family transcriptional activator